MNNFLPQHSRWPSRGPRRSTAPAISPLSSLQEGACLAAWPAHLLAVIRKDLSICISADVVIHIKSHWFPLQSSTTLPDGTLVAFPSGVIARPSKPIILLHRLPLVGRVGNRNSLTSQGKPILSTDMCQYRKGLQDASWRSGYLEGLTTWTAA